MILLSSIKSHRLILITALLLTFVYNWTFFNHINQVYPILSKHFLFFISLSLLLFISIALVFCLLCFKFTTKPILVLFVTIAAFSAYYMNTFDVIIDKIMIRNIFETNIKEASDLLTFKLILYVVFLALLPSIWVYHQPLATTPWRQALPQRWVLIFLLLLALGSQVLFFSKNYSSFFREHKSLRFYTNPLTPIYSVFNFIANLKDSHPRSISALGVDAQIPVTDLDRDLVIIIVGETARWDRFSLNGYTKPTNPLLIKENVISFKNFSSCGTSTSVSVPCMFSALGRDKYSEKKFNSSENLLDVLAHAEVNVLWRDNNSDDKGVAKRIQNVVYQDYKTPKNNTICDVECRDEGMLIGLQDYIDQHPKGDITIVLHQMGSHGPAYYKRYPTAFEKFKPTCQNNLLEECNLEEISNAYDNTILYTDYFLSKVINILKFNTPKFETAMFYLSDHGESLGENGVYLHGMPYSIAPESQTHVGAIMWLSDNFSQGTYAGIKKKENMNFSQDNLFHTVLGMMEIETQVYQPEKDIMRIQ